MATYACVWIDHRLARIVGVRTDSEPIVLTVHADGTGSPPVVPGLVGPAYLRRVIEAVRWADALMVVGPGRTKYLLRDEIAQEGSLAGRLVRVHASERLSEGQIGTMIREVMDAQEGWPPPA